MFMKKGSVLFEVYPYKYYKRSYFPLTAQFDVHHVFVQNVDPTSLSAQMWLQNVPLEECMKTFQCRKFARKQDIDMTPSHMAELLHVVHQVESGRVSRLLPTPTWQILYFFRRECSKRVILKLNRSYLFIIGILIIIYNLFSDKWDQ